MKKLLTALLIFVSFNLIAQKNSIEKNTLDSKIDYTNYCLYKFQKSQKIGIGATFIGASLIAIGNLNTLNGLDKATHNYNLDMARTQDAFTQIRLTAKYEVKLQDIEKKRKTLTTAGGVLAIGGCVLNLISYRWLKKAYVVPIKNGAAIGVKYNF
jgi:hypothetical protein